MCISFLLFSCVPAEGALRCVLSRARPSHVFSTRLCSHAFLLWFFVPLPLNSFLRRWNGARISEIQRAKEELRGPYGLVPISVGGFSKFALSGEQGPVLGDVAKWTTLVSDSFADKQHVLRNQGAP